MAEEAKTIPTVCIAAKDASGKMEKITIQRRPVGANDVQIKIRYSGICHSDIHTAKGEWGPQTYPLCVGHEILGKVIAVGDKVTKFKVGDDAGVGCFTESCRKCEECKDGVEQYCTGPRGQTGTYGSKCEESFQPGGVTHGGYSEFIVVDENYTIRIPEILAKNPASTPLLCAGITCFSPFQFYGLKAGMKLGIVGMGGLGHIACKIGKAMGAEVTVISRSPGKEETARALGASNFIVSTDKEQMKAAAKSLHFIYDSVAFDHPLLPNIALLKAQGKYIVVGGVPTAVDVNPFALIGRRITLAGSCIGGIKETQDMIDFCAEHNIVSEMELIPATPEAVDVAWDRAIAGDVKYRFVIDTEATLNK